MGKKCFSFLLYNRENTLFLKTQSGHLIRNINHLEDFKFFHINNLREQNRVKIPKVLSDWFSFRGRSFSSKVASSRAALSIGYFFVAGIIWPETIRLPIKLWCVAPFLVGFLTTITTITRSDRSKTIQFEALESLGPFARGTQNRGQIYQWNQQFPDCSERKSWSRIFQNIYNQFIYRKTTWSMIWIRHHVPKFFFYWFLY